MVRILLIVNSLRAGGAEKHVVSLVNHLDSREFELTLACLHPGTDLLPELDSRRIGEVVTCAVRGKVDLEAAARLGGLVDTAAIDVILCTNVYAMLYGWLARRRSARKPRLVEVFHTTILGNWRARLQMGFYWPLFRQCDHLVYVCENQRRHWRRRGLRAAADSRIYNGIDVRHFAPAPTDAGALRLRGELGFGPDDYVVGICAGMRPEKAHTDLLAAVARLRAAEVPIRCLMIGDGVERQAIERRIAELELGDVVAITGYQADVRPYIAACDVMALVSHAVETFSISALESMAMERPMVMSRIGGATEQVTDGVNGFTFEAGNIDGLTECLRRLVDPVARRAMGARARQVVVERFDVDAMARAYEALLRAYAPGR